MPKPPTITIETVQKNLDADLRWRERRHQQWTENYQLYLSATIRNRRRMTIGSMGDGVEAIMEILNIGGV